METDSQNSHIIAYLKDGNALTPLEALRLFGCLRLSGRIYELKQKGFAIQSRMIHTLDGKQVAQYYI